MSGIPWPLVGLVSKLLDEDEREAVLGDLLEINEGAWQGFLDVSGLVFRRQIGLWKDPRPWLAGFVVALPSSYLLMYVSLSVTCTYQRLVNHRIYGWHGPTGHEGFPLLLCHIFLLIAWSWSAAYIVGSVSRRTLCGRALHCHCSPRFSVFVCTPQDLFRRFGCFCFFRPQSPVPGEACETLRSHSALRSFWRSR